jgi:TRAP-type mannitol/chloroaromatic compound transport system permease large subunit
MILNIRMDVAWLDIQRSNRLASGQIYHRWAGELPHLAMQIMAVCITVWIPDVVRWSSCTDIV